MQYQNYLIDAIDVVLGRDIPDESFADAVAVQACVMAGVNREEVRGLRME